MIMWHRPTHLMRDAAKMTEEEIEAARLCELEKVDKLIEVLDELKKQEGESENNGEDSSR